MRNTIYGIVVLVTLVLPTRSEGITRVIKDWCRGAFGRAVGHEQNSYDRLSEIKIDTIDDLIHSFWNGALPIAGNREHEVAFEIYRALKMGNASGVPPDAMKRIQKILKKYPDLEKEPFRTIELVRGRQEYERTANLDTLAKKLLENGRSTQHLLFKVPPDASLWKKIKSNRETGETKTSGSGKVTKRRTELERLVTDEDLAAIFDEEVRTLLAQPKPDLLRTYATLFARLAQLKEAKEALGYDVRPLSDIMVALVHNFGLSDPKTEAKLRSSDGVAVLEGVREMMGSRHTLAEHLGHERGYSELLSKLAIEPKTIHTDQALSELLIEIEKEVLSRPSKKQSGTSRRWVRQLSLYEAPFRSCLGGDCSSRTYFGRALDPNYHYFTLTNPFTGESSGHVTIVLGTAQADGKPVQVAFVDKIQNISNSDLAPMLEGIRQSVAEKGYELAIPTDLGDHNGISNYSTTSLFVESELKTFTRSERTYSGFMSHPHRFKGVESTLRGFSRADSGLQVKPLLPLSANGSVAIVSGEMPKRTKLPPLDLADLRKQLIELKHGSADDKLRYLQSAPGLERMPEKGDPEYRSTVENWVTDKTLPISLRNRAITTLFADGSYSDQAISKFLDSFEPVDQRVLIQNWLQTPPLAKKLLSQRSTFFKYSVGHLDSMKKLSDSMWKTSDTFKMVRTYWNSNDRSVEQWMAEHPSHADSARRVSALKKYAAKLAHLAKKPKGDLDQTADAFLSDPEVAYHEKSHLLDDLFLVNPTLAAKHVSVVAKDLKQTATGVSTRGKNEQMEPVEDISPYLPLIHALDRHGGGFFFDKSNPKHAVQIGEHLMRNPQWVQDEAWCEIFSDTVWYLREPKEVMTFWNALPRLFPKGRAGNEGDFLGGKGNDLYIALSRLYENLQRMNPEQKREAFTLVDYSDLERARYVLGGIHSGAPLDLVEKLREQALPRLESALPSFRDSFEKELGTGEHFGVSERRSFGVASTAPLLNSSGQALRQETHWRSAVVEPIGASVSFDHEGRAAVFPNSFAVRTAEGQVTYFSVGEKFQVQDIHSVGNDLVAVTLKLTQSRVNHTHLQFYKIAKNSKGLTTATLVGEDSPKSLLGAYPDFWLERQAFSSTPARGGVFSLSRGRTAYVYDQGKSVGAFRLPPHSHSDFVFPDGAGAYFVSLSKKSKGGGMISDDIYRFKDGKLQPIEQNSTQTFYYWHYVPDSNVQVGTSDKKVVWVKDGRVLDSQSISVSDGNNVIGPQGQIILVPRDGNVIQFEPGKEPREFILNKPKFGTYGSSTLPRIALALTQSPTLVFSRGDTFFWTNLETGKTSTLVLSRPVRGARELPDGSVALLLEAEVDDSDPHYYTQTISAPVDLGGAVQGSN